MVGQAVAVKRQKHHCATFSERHFAVKTPLIYFYFPFVISRLSLSLAFVIKDLRPLVFPRLGRLEHAKTSKLLKSLTAPRTKVIQFGRRGRERRRPQHRERAEGRGYGLRTQDYQASDLESTMTAGSLHSQVSVYAQRCDG